MNPVGYCSTHGLFDINNLPVDWKCPKCVGVTQTATVDPEIIRISLVQRIARRVLRYG